jgi:hypothetical protein
MPPKCKKKAYGVPHSNLKLILVIFTKVSHREIGDGLHSCAIAKALATRGLQDNRR